MGLSIGATAIQTQLLINKDRTSSILGQATERLSTGLRINSGRDDPAGLIEAANLRGQLVEINAQLRSNNSLQRQANVEQSGRQLVSDVLQEVRGHLIEAADSFTSTEQRQAIQAQIDSALDSLGNISATTGVDIPEELQSLRSGGTSSLGEGDAAAAVELVDEQLSAFNLESAALGAYQKYTLDVDQALAEARAVATASSLSLREDADFAEETSNLIKGKILNEASLRTIALSQQLEREGIGLLFDSLRI